MPLLNLCTNKVSRSRFAKWTVQSVDASVEKGPAFDTAGNTSSGAVYSQTKTVRHGMRAAIVVVAGRGGGRRGVDSARRGETNACAAARDTTRRRRVIFVVSEFVRCVDVLCRHLLAGTTSYVASGLQSAHCSELIIRPAVESYDRSARGVPQRLCYVAQAPSSGSTNASVA